MRWYWSKYAIMDIIYSIKSPYLEKFLCSLQFLTNFMQFGWKTKELWQFKMWSANPWACIMSISNLRISAAIWCWTLKFWLIIYFVIRNKIYQSQKKWSPCESYWKLFLTTSVLIIILLILNKLSNTVKKLFANFREVYNRLSKHIRVSV